MTYGQAMAAVLMGLIRGGLPPDTAAAVEAAYLEHARGMLASCKGCILVQSDRGGKRCTSWPARYTYEDFKRDRPTLVLIGPESMLRGFAVLGAFALELSANGYKADAVRAGSALMEQAERIKGMTSGAYLWPEDVDDRVRNAD